MHRTLVLPDDSLIRSHFGSDQPSKRAYRARLKRAEAAGLLPRRIYTSSQRFAYDAREVEAALAGLPRHHVVTLAPAATGAEQVGR